MYINNQMMDLPAQKVESAPNSTIKYPNPSELLTQTINIKYQELKSKISIKYNMIRSYSPIHVDKYNECFSQFQTILTNMQEGQNIDFNKYLPLIFGALQGSTSNTEPQKILIKKFGANIEKIQIDQIIKGKVKNINYGNDKRRQTNIREVSNKECFQSMGEYYDLKEIKNHRKTCSSIKGYLTALKNFMDCMKDISQNQIFTQESIQNIRYIEFANKELSFMKLKIPPYILGESEQGMIEQVEEKKEEKVKSLSILEQLHITPIKRQIVNGQSPKEETASGQKDSPLKNQQMKPNSNQQNQNKPKEDQSKQTRHRRTKEEIEKERLERLRDKQMKAIEKEERQKQRLFKLQEKERERLEKEAQKEAQRLEKERQRIQREKQKQEKQKKKQEERIAKQEQKKQKQKQKLEKQAKKQAQRIAKQKKNSPGQLLTNWMKTQKTTPLKKTQVQLKILYEPATYQQQKTKFLSSINSNMRINQLKDMFLTSCMKNEDNSFEPYYSTICLHKSRLQFDKFLINQQRFQQYFSPHQQYQNGKYDDSSIEYQDFCGDFCDEKMDEMSIQEQQQASDNSAIVPDSYISQDEISSLNQSKDQIRYKADQGPQWSFNNPNNYTAEKYIMFCCYDDELIPLPLNQPEESKELTVTLKCELYKQIHGSYGPKDVLIKKLSTIADKVPKSYLDALIKETTTKRGYQRLVKPEIIDFLSEQRQNFAKQLEDIKKKRDEDNMIEMKGKMNEKQRQIQRLILQEAGTYYIIDMLHFLREKGYRMLKRELKEFIDARTGSQWDDVRKRMSKMQLKSKEKMTEFLKKNQKQSKDKKESNQQEKREGQQKEQGSPKKDEDQNKQDKMQPQI